VDGRVRATQGEFLVTLHPFEQSVSRHVALSLEAYFHSWTSYERLYEINIELAENPELCSHYLGIQGAQPGARLSG
jgi:hypothetical protein